MEAVPPSAPTPGAAGQRRSSRVIIAVPIIIVGKDGSGPFTASGETLVVNRESARIKTEQQLLLGMEVEITVPSRNLSRKARVVFVDEAHEGEYAVELTTPANLWGVHFPPVDWEKTNPRAQGRKKFSSLGGWTT